MAETGPLPEDDLRERAVKRLRKRQAFFRHLVTYVLVNLFLIAIWAVSGVHTVFWPVFPLLGWGIGIALHAWDVFGPSGFDEARIRREMDRMRELGLRCVMPAGGVGRPKGVGLRHVAALSRRHAVSPRCGASGS